jgi:hypothetical protein
MSDLEYTDPDDTYTPPDMEPDMEPDVDPTPPIETATDPGVHEGQTFREPQIDELPSELRFGALIGPYGETADSWGEEYNYSTTTDSYIGAQSGREIDPYTGTEKK